MIQLAAAYYHLVTKRSFRGLLNNFDKAYVKLEVFQPEYLGVYMAPLLKFIEQGKREVERLGRVNIDHFNDNLIPKLQFHKPVSIDLAVELKSVLSSDEFSEAVKLLNQGYIWEAHEAFEDIWRERQGNARTFVQAFVQMSAGYSFLNNSKLDSTTYLFEKAIGKLRQFEHDDADLSRSLHSLIDSIKSTLNHLNVKGEKHLVVPKIVFPVLITKEPML